MNPRKSCLPNRMSRVIQDPSCDGLVRISWDRLVSARLFKSWVDGSPIAFSNNESHVEHKWDMLSRLKCCVGIFCVWTERSSLITHTHTHARARTHAHARTRRVVYPRRLRGYVMSGVETTSVSVSSLSMRYQPDLRGRSKQLHILAIDRASVAGMLWIDAEIARRVCYAGKLLVDLSFKWNVR
jgi:hypothetical protein